MVECKYRKEVEKLGSGVQAASNVDETWKLVLQVGASRQSFINGLCTLLTVNSFGQMECRQPNCNEDNCPDIKHLMIDVDDGLPPAPPM